MQLKYARCMGLDVHKDSVVACLRVEEEGRVTRTVRTFGTFTRDLLSLQEWLVNEGVKQVAMEATGVYWKPVWHILEPVVPITLANPAHIKNVPGRKTDVKDAEWIGELLAHGLIEASFVPPEAIQQLRGLTRDRRQFLRERTQHIQRVQKVLQDANIKVDSVISDLMGKSGRAFLDAIVSGECDPEQLATLADRRLKACHDDIVESLRGVVTEQHRGALRRHLQTIDHIMAMVGEIDAEVAALLEPFHRQVALLDTIPGVDIASATVIVAEIGVDMSRFPSSGHLVSWAGLCPRADESAGKRRNTQIGKGGQWLKTTLVQAAWAAVRKKEEHHLKSLFLRLKNKRGAKKAIIAVAASMMNSVWFMLTRDQPYKDPEGSAQDPAKKATEAARLIRKLKKLGYEVALPTAA